MSMFGSLTADDLDDILSRFLREPVVAVETGTGAGGSTGALSARFASVHTVELDEQHRPTHAELGCPRVSFWYGDSAEVVPRLLDEIGEQAVFFYLDAHHSTGSPDDAPFPLWEELKAARDHGNPDDIVVVDDVHCFGIVRHELVAGHLWQEVTKKSLLKFMGPEWLGFEHSDRFVMSRQEQI